MLTRGIMRIIKQHMRRPVLIRHTARIQEISGAVSSAISAARVHHRPSRYQQAHASASVHELEFQNRCQGLAYVHDRLEQHQPMLRLRTEARWFLHATACHCSLRVTNSSSRYSANCASCPSVSRHRRHRQLLSCPSTCGWRALVGPWRWLWGGSTPGVTCRLCTVDRASCIRIRIRRCSPDGKCDHKAVLV